MVFIAEFLLNPIRDAVVVRVGVAETLKSDGVEAQFAIGADVVIMQDLDEIFPTGLELHRAAVLGGEFVEVMDMGLEPSKGVIRDGGEALFAETVG